MHMHNVLKVRVWVRVVNNFYRHLHCLGFDLFFAVTSDGGASMENAHSTSRDVVIESEDGHLCIAAAKLMHDK
jgi:hypothetical protein